MNPQGQNNQPAVENPLAVMQPGERVICTIKRHPIGMLGMYAMAGFLLAILAALAFAVAPSLLESSFETHQTRAIGGLVFVIFAALTAIFLFISHYVYWGNRWVVTSDSITQIVQNGLFNKQSGQLSLGNLEDVTAEKNGLLTHLFDYGVLKAETAGERSKFMFLYCPHPDEYAKQILTAREEFELVHHGGKQLPQPYRAADYQTPSDTSAPQSAQPPQPPVSTDPSAQ